LTGSGNIKTLMVSTMEECAEECNLDATCISFDWCSSGRFANPNTCALKSSGSAATGFRDCKNVPSLAGTCSGCDNYEKSTKAFEIHHVASTAAAFGVALADGRAISWGKQDSGGNSPWNGKIASVLDADEALTGGTGFAQCATKLYSTQRAFMAKLETCPIQVSSSSSARRELAERTPLRRLSHLVAPTLIAWGDSFSGGSLTTAEVAAIDSAGGIQQVAATNGAFAVLTANGGVVTFGSSFEGGAGPTPALSSGVTSIEATEFAFAAMKSDGTVAAWGDIKSGGALPSAMTTELAADGGAASIYANNVAFAALTSNGNVVAWGDPGNGGNLSNVASTLASGTVLTIQPSGSAFTATIKSTS